MSEKLQVVDIADFPVVLKKAGFASVEEFNNMVCQAKMTDPQDRAAFRRWQINDATKKGLEDLNRGVKTPVTHPDHHVVGKYFGGYGFNSESTQIYHCTAYDPDYDYKLESVTGPPDERKVSPRAINATFWSADDRGDYWSVCQWGVRVPKVRLCDRTGDETVQCYDKDKGLALHLTNAASVNFDERRVMACEHCRGGSGTKLCGARCIRGKTLEQARTALPNIKLHVSEY